MVKTLLQLVEDQDPNTSQESYPLLIAICDFEFLFGLETLQMKLSITSSLSSYRQGKDVDVIKARECAMSTKDCLKKCRDDASFEEIWIKTELLSKEIKSVLKDSKTNVTLENQD